jgi:selenocysteine lyase/cysteine desulfurase
VRPDRLAAIRPHSAGWYAGEDPWQSLYGGPLRLARESRRLDVSPAWSAWIGAEASLGLIESIGVEAIHEHDTGLADALLERLDLEPQGSAICSLEVSAAAGDRLAAAGVCAARRDGRLRLGFHLHNTMDDVERVAGLLC